MKPNIFTITREGEWEPGTAMTVNFFKRLRHPCTGRQRGSPLQIERPIWRTAGPNPLVPCTRPCRYSNGSSKIIVAVCQPFLPFRFFCAFRCTFLVVKKKQLQQQKPDNRQQESVDGRNSSLHIGFGRGIIRKCGGWRIILQRNRYFLNSPDWSSAV